MDTLFRDLKSMKQEKVQDSAPTALPSASYLFFARLECGIHSQRFFLLATTCKSLLGSAVRKQTTNKLAKAGSCAFAHREFGQLELPGCCLPGPNTVSEAAVSRELSDLAQQACFQRWKLGCCAIFTR
eukprot:1027405-Amphidinium_carterae.1